MELELPRSPAVRQSAWAAELGTGVDVGKHIEPLSKAASGLIPATSNVLLRRMDRPVGVPLVPIDVMLEVMNFSVLAVEVPKTVAVGYDVSVMHLMAAPYV